MSAVRWVVWRTSSFAPYAMEPISNYPTRKRAQAHVDILRTNPRYVGTVAEVRRVVEGRIVSDSQPIVIQTDEF